MFAPGHLTKQTPEVANSRLSKHSENYLGTDLLDIKNPIDTPFKSLKKKYNHSYKFPRRFTYT